MDDRTPVLSLLSSLFYQNGTHSSSLGPGPNAHICQVCCILGIACTNTTFVCVSSLRCNAVHIIVYSVNLAVCEVNPAKWQCLSTCTEFYCLPTAMRIFFCNHKYEAILRDEIAVQILWSNWAGNSIINLLLRNFNQPQRGEVVWQHGSRIQPLLNGDTPVLLPCWSFCNR